MAESVNYNISENGGKFRLADGIDLVIPRGVLWRQCRIRVTIDQTGQKRSFVFDTSRKNTVLPKAIAIVATKQAVAGIKDKAVLYKEIPNSKPEPIHPVWDDIMVIWHITDLASYFYRQ